MSRIVYQNAETARQFVIVRWSGLKPVGTPICAPKQMLVGHWSDWFAFYIELRFYDVVKLNWKGLLKMWGV